jgi:hypothetical protein
MKPVVFAATCVVDGTAASTFDNKTYPIKLGRCWHVMMMEVPKEPAGPVDYQSSRNGGNKSSNVAVLVRGSNSGLEKVSTGTHAFYHQRLIQKLLIRIAISRVEAG